MPRLVGSEGSLRYSPRARRVLSHSVTFTMFATEESTSALTRSAMCPALPDVRQVRGQCGLKRYGRGTLAARTEARQLLELRRKLSEFGTRNIPVRSQIVFLAVVPIRMEHHNGRVRPFLAFDIGQPRSCLRANDKRIPYNPSDDGPRYSIHNRVGTLLKRYARVTAV